MRNLLKIVSELYAKVENSYNKYSKQLYKKEDEVWQKFSDGISKLFAK